MGIGLTLRDSNSSHVYNRTLVLLGLYALDEGEAIGLFESLSWVSELDLRNVVIEMDAKLVVDAFNANRLDSISVFGDIIESCKQKSRAFPLCSVRWVVREANFVAHRLARIARNFPSPFTWVKLPLMWKASLICLVCVSLLEQLLFQKKKTKKNLLSLIIKTNSFLGFKKKKLTNKIKIA
ncbi:hypothetical protein ACS0TY_002400 [Phlomoides rotata]